ncbi:Protein of unknown function [Bacillus toyonensis]|nr:Protein of unknown function [Bacillus toyonensis]
MDGTWEKTGNVTN